LRKNTFAKNLKNEFKWLLFVLPLILMILVISYYPIFYAFYGSFRRVPEMAEVFNSPFTGLDNYRFMLNDPRFGQATFITFALMGWSLVYIPLSFVIAYAINSFGKSRLQSVFRIAFFAPYVIPSVATLMIFQVFLQTSGGALNSLLSIIAGQEIAVGFLSDPNIARMGVSIISNYSSLPFGIIICMAGLQTIPQEILESAEMDGANTLQRLFHIVVPNMKGIFTFLLVMQVINGFQRITDLIIIGMGWPTGFPGGSLMSLMMLIYQQSFFRQGAIELNANFGVVYAMTISLFLMIMMVTLLNLFLTRKKSDG